MEKMNKSIILGLAFAGSMGIASIAAANSNPILICVYTSNTLKDAAGNALSATDLGKIIGTGVITNTGATTSGAQWIKSWGTNIPSKGSRVCSVQFSGTQGWNFAATAPLSYSSSMHAASGYPTCEVRGLVTNADQIGNGIEYALHYSIIRASYQSGIGAGISKCVLSNVDVDA